MSVQDAAEIFELYERRKLALLCEGNFPTPFTELWLYESQPEYLVDFLLRLGSKKFPVAVEPVKFEAHSFFPREVLQLLEMRLRASCEQPSPPKLALVCKMQG